MSDDKPWSDMQTSFEKIFEEHLWVDCVETRFRSGATFDRDWRAKG
jgi:hypothetical protein